MASRIEKTKVFLLQKFDENPRYTEHKAEKDYRIEHTMRVANIGKQIAEAEDMDTEALVIACLLHDVSYCEEMKEKEDWFNHGRRAAAIARPFWNPCSLSRKRCRRFALALRFMWMTERILTGSVRRLPFRSVMRTI